MRPTLLPPLLALVILTSACGGPPDDDRPDTRHRQGEPVPSLPVLNTPTGEPLGRAQCDHALAAWFIRTDSDHDGAVTAAEFSQDARLVFSRLDRDADGFVTPDELQQARMAFLDAPGPEDRPKRPRGDGKAAGDGPGGTGPGGGRQSPKGGMGGGMGGGGDAPQASGPAGTLDPIMTADSNLDFKVSGAEFAAHVSETFAGLDKNADQRLSLDEVTTACPSRPAAPSRR